MCVFLGPRFPVGRLQQGFLLDARTEIRCCRRSRLLLRPAVGLSVHKGERKNTQLCTDRCTWMHTPLSICNAMRWVYYFANAHLVKHSAVPDLRWISARRLGVWHWYDPEYSNTTAWANIYTITHLMHKQNVSKHLIFSDCDDI